MSQRALLLAVRDYLRSELDYSNSECEVTFDGKPLPVWGGTRARPFVAVHPGAWNPVTDLNSAALEESIGVLITVTVRAGQVPTDRIGPNLYVGPAGSSLDEELRRIIAVLHHDKGAYPVLELANTTLGSTVNGFIEPLRFVNGGTPQAAQSEWFAAIVSKNTQSIVGIYQTLTFGNAKRIQTIEEQA